MIPLPPYPSPYLGFNLLITLSTGVWGWPRLRGGGGQEGLGGLGGLGGDLRGVVTPSPSLSIHWGRTILEIQGRPPLVEGRRGFPLEGGKWQRLWKGKGGKYRGGSVRDCLCAGQGPALLLGGADYITTLDGLLSYLGMVSRSFWWGRIHHYHFRNRLLHVKGLISSTICDSCVALSTMSSIHC